MTYIGFPILSLIFMLLFLGLYFSKNRINLYENKIVIGIMIFNVLGLILELSCYAVMAYFKAPDTFFGMLILKSYIAYIAVFDWLITGYIFVLTNKHYGDNCKNNDYIRKYFYKVLLIFSPITLIILGVTYGMPLQYVNNPSNFYTYGLCTKLIFYSVLFLFPIWIGRCVYSTYSNADRKDINKRIYFLLGGSIFMASAGGVTQFIDQSVLIITTAHSLLLSLIYFTIENPDMKLITQLELAKNQAEKANRAKSDFLSSMSHEIRTPLNAIVGFSEDIVDRVMDMDAEIKEDAKYIQEASKTLLEIVGNILDINKIESDKMEVKEVVYNPRDLIENIARMNSVRLDGKDISYHLNIAGDLPYELIGDKVHIKSILNNLITNAMKYTDKGSINVDVHSINEKEKATLIISVRDTGRGIKAENINRLFTKFDRMDMERNTTTEGTGLGLAITKSLLDMMGGKINVESSFGQGSLFMVTIPQKIATMYNAYEKLNNDYAQSTNMFNNEVHNKFNNLRVLIVDDNKLNLKVAIRALDGITSFIDTATNGIECLDKIKTGNTYDLILMDIMMPEMSGVRALHELKKIPGFNTPVIALTADAVNGAETEYLEEGFNSYIAKPFKKDQIAKVINDIFK